MSGSWRPGRAQLIRTTTWSASETSGTAQVYLLATGIRRARVNNESARVFVQMNSHKKKCRVDDSVSCRGLILNLQYTHTVQ